MNSIASSHKRIDKVSSDNLSLSFDLLSNLTYMSVMACRKFAPRPDIGTLLAPALQNSYLLWLCEYAG